MKKILCVFISLIAIVTLVSCSLPSESDGQTSVLSAEQILDSLAEDGLSVNEIVVYTAETDPNKMLGRPNQYVSKANFEFGSVEVFKDGKDLENRKDYILSVTKNLPALTEYVIVNDLYLLRLNKDLTPDQVSEYEKAFIAIK